MYLRGWWYLWWQREWQWWWWWWWWPTMVWPANLRKSRTGLLECSRLDPDRSFYCTRQAWPNHMPICTPQHPHQNPPIIICICSPCIPIIIIVMNSLPIIDHRPRSHIYALITLVLIDLIHQFRLQYDNGNDDYEHDDQWVTKPNRMRVTLLLQTDGPALTSPPHHPEFRGGRPVKWQKVLIHDIFWLNALIIYSFNSFQSCIPKKRNNWYELFCLKKMKRQKSGPTI